MQPYSNLVPSSEAASSCSTATVSDTRSRKPSMKWKRRRTSPKVLVMPIATTSGSERAA
jgi:hypothetical protein